ncbi:MAG: tetratricopeptide repeat protein [Ruminococcus sp.]|nr:tetratricopeptide repeat protein [Ruminococcus sp.]
MKTKLKIIIPAVIAVAAVIIALLTIDFTPNEEADFSSLLHLAQNYLMENNYEQAIAEFEKAIDLDPMNAEAYLGIAEAYEAIGDREKALEWLEKGYELTGDERLKEMIDRLLMPEETVTETAASERETEETTEETTAESTVETTESPADSEEDNAEKVRADAMAVMDMFNICKITGTPDSVTYYCRHSDDSNTWTRVCKCCYNDKGELAQSTARWYW